MFCGINAINLDAKGRMAVPARYRDKLSEESGKRLIITIDTEDHCLLMYPLNAWKVIEAKIEALPSFNKTTRRIQRLLIGHATEAELDANNRILVPPLLREYAGLEKHIVLIGQGKKFEIWSEENWNSGRKDWLAEGLQESGGLPEQLANLSL